MRSARALLEPAPEPDEAQQEAYRRRNAETVRQWNAEIDASVCVVCGVPATVRSEEGFGEEIIVTFRCSKHADGLGPSPYS